MIKSLSAALETDLDPLLFAAIADALEEEGRPLHADMWRALPKVRRFPLWDGGMGVWVWVRGWSHSNVWVGDYSHNNVVQREYERTTHMIDDTLFKALPGVYAMLVQAHYRSRYDAFEALVEAALTLGGFGKATWTTS